MMHKTPRVINDRKITIALVGCGRIASNHFKAIELHKERLTLAAVCDSNPERLTTAISQCGVDGYDNLDELLRYSNADVVALCTPSGLHPMQAIKVAQSGRHVLTEKPMATRWQEGVQMVKACDDAGVHLFVVKQNRLNATLQKLKQAIDKERFGRILLSRTTPPLARRVEPSQIPACEFPARGSSKSVSV